MSEGQCRGGKSYPCIVPTKPDRVTTMEALSGSVRVGSFSKSIELDAIGRATGGEMKAMWSRKVRGVVGRDDEAVVGNSMTA